jgi:hypothetical protein
MASRLNPDGFENACRQMPMRAQPIEPVPESWAGPLPVYDPVRTIGMNAGSDEDNRAKARTIAHLHKGHGG